MPLILKGRYGILEKKEGKWYIDEHETDEIFKVFEGKRIKIERVDD